MSEADRELPLDDDDKLGAFKRDIAKDADIVDEQRDKANEDMRFVNVTGGMWEDWLTDDFPEDRVKLELDMVSNFLQRFIGEWNQNRVGVEYKPNDAGTTKDDSDLLNGIYRSDFRRHSGKIATDNAVDEAATCGYGAFKLATKFEDDEDPENDNMHIEWRPIYNAYNSVYWDQSAQRIDKRDARHCTVLKPFTKAEFEREFPDKAPSSAYEPTNRSFQNRTRSTIDFIYVATRYQIIKKLETVFVYNNLASGKVESYTAEEHGFIEDELKADELREFVRKRRIRRQRVEKTVFSGADILEPTRRIAGKWIPIVPFYAYRSYVDGVEWYRGLVRKLKDAARLFNMQVSQLAENAASNGQAVPIFDPDQIEGPSMAELWANKNNKPYLLARALRNTNGDVVQHGPTGYSQPAQLDGSTTALLSIVPDYIQTTTGGAPQETLNPDMSGKAIKALIQRENMNTQVINDNIANAIAWGGEIYQAMAAEVYTSRRIVNIIGKDGTESQKQLQQVVLDSETGKMVESNVLQGKKFQAYADVGPQYETLGEQTVEDIKGMLEIVPTIPGGEEYTDVLLAALIDNIHGVGLDSLKERNRRIMVAKGMVKPETPEEEALVQQVQQQQQQEDPQRALIEAAAGQQQAEGRNLDAGTIQKVAIAQKTEAETAEILADMTLNKDKADLERFKLFLEAQKQVTEQAQEGLQ